MTAHIDLYYSFRSPYSYLATKGAAALEAEYDAKIHLRPVLPLAIRRPEFFNPSNLKRVKYILLDWERRAEMLGMPHVWPQPDPVVQDLKKFEISTEQPYIYRLVTLGIEAERRACGLAFAKEVSALIFGGTKGWDEGTHLADAAVRAGLYLADMESVIGDRSNHLEEAEQNRINQAEAGHEGVPLFVYGGEPFFGQDRIDSLCWQLAKDGLKK